MAGGLIIGSNGGVLIRDGMAMIADPAADPCCGEEMTPAFAPTIARLYYAIEMATQWSLPVCGQAGPSGSANTGSYELDQEGRYGQPLPVVLCVPGTSDAAILAYLNEGTHPGYVTIGGHQLARVTDNDPGYLFGYRSQVPLAAKATMSWWHTLIDGDPYTVGLADYELVVVGQWRSVAASGYHVTLDAMRRCCWIDGAPDNLETKRWPDVYADHRSLVDAPTGDAGQVNDYRVAVAERGRVQLRLTAAGHLTARPFDDSSSTMHVLVQVPALSASLAIPTGGQAQPTSKIAWGQIDVAVDTGGINETIGWGGYGTYRSADVAAWWNQWSGFRHGTTEDEVNCADVRQRFATLTESQAWEGSDDERRLVVTI